MDDWQVAVTLNHREVGSTPTPASKLTNASKFRADTARLRSLPCGVTGNISRFEREDSRFKPWQGNRGERDLPGSWMQTWPWQRAAYAEALERLMAAEARTVAFDILFDLPSGYGEADDRRLQAALETHGCCH